MKCLVVLLPILASAATFNSPTCNESDVVNTIAMATNGDTEASASSRMCTRPAAIDNQCSCYAGMEIRVHGRLRSAKWSRRPLPHLRFVRLERAELKELYQLPSARLFSDYVARAVGVRGE